MFSNTFRKSISNIQFIITWNSLKTNNELEAKFKHI